MSQNQNEPTENTNLPYMSRGYVLSPRLDWCSRIKLIFGFRILSDTMLVTQKQPGKMNMATKFFVVAETTLGGAVTSHEQRQKAAGDKAEARAKKFVELHRVSK
jgi:hypothetical protein